MSARHGRLLSETRCQNVVVAEIAYDDETVLLLTFDGVPSQSITAAQLFTTARREVGAPLRITVQHDKTEREVTLIRRELLCNAGAQPCGAWVSAAR